MKSKNKTNDYLKDIDKNKQINILTTAISNIESTIFSIDSVKIALEGEQKNINEHYISMYEKFAIAFSCILMFFIGAPLGSIIKKGGLGLPIVFAVLIFIIFHFVNTFGKKLAEENAVPSFLGTWLSTIILLPLAFIFTYNATNDIAMTINFDWLIDPLKKIFKKLIPAKKQI